MFSIRSLNRRISFIKLRGMCGNNHNLIVLEADGTCPICKDVSNKAAEHSVQRTAKWSGHYETCPAKKRWLLHVWLLAAANAVRSADPYNVGGSEKPSDAAQMLGLTYELG